jgi:hypothetical protein
VERCQIFGGYWLDVSQHEILRWVTLVEAPSLLIPLKGTAIYVFFVIPNFAAGTGLASTVLCDFFIDGAAVGSFSHESDGSGAFTYNTLVYRNTSIPAGDHVLLIETTGASPAVIIFDYALYTYVPPVFFVANFT